MPENVEGLSPEELAALEDPPGSEGGEGEDEDGSEGGEGGDQPGGTEKKPKKTAQERIDEITFKFRESERQGLRWKELAEAKIDKSKPAPKPTDRPAALSYETVEEYEDALYEWYDSKRQKKALVKQGQEDQQTAFANFNKNAVALRKKHEDFDEAIKAPIFTDAMRAVIFSIDNGPMIAYHLGKNPEVANKIKGLPPERQMYEVSKLETQLLLAKTGKTVTTAPKPIDPVSDNGGAELDPDKMTTAQWMKWDNKKRLARITKELGGNA
jgi:hypothetical protein